MRSNLRVCLEVDSVRGADDWVTVVASGCFEELPDIPESRPARQRAHQLLRQRPMWWEPGAITTADRDHSQGSEPVYYRINIEHVTGHRAATSPHPPPLTWAACPEPA